MNNQLYSAGNIHDRFDVVSASVEAWDGFYGDMSRSDTFDRDARIADKLGRPISAIRYRQCAQNLRTGLPILNGVQKETEPLPSPEIGLDELFPEL